VATQQQQRVCLNAQCGGFCVGESLQTVPCTPVTIVDCRVGSWRNVSECSASCGVGLQRQARDILVNPENGGLPCSTLQQAVQCFQKPCDLPCIVVCLFLYSNVYSLRLYLIPWLSVHLYVFFPHRSFLTTHTFVSSSIKIF
jgi:hypothetical protein